MSAANASPPQKERATACPAGPTPNPAAKAPYRSPAPSPPVDLWLAGNEGRTPKGVAPNGPLATNLSRYPGTEEVAQAAALHYRVEPDDVLVTAGADDGLLRIALGFLGPGREAILPSPTFEMIPRYIALAGGTVRDVAWTPGAPYPVEGVLAAVNERTSVIYIVSPNNPTGSIATEADLIRIAEAAPGALVVLDAAYGEFADNDLTRAAEGLSNVVILRTLSKAFGCAGLRVGFVLGAASILQSLAAAGNPYPCAAPALEGASQALASDPSGFVAQVRKEREELVSLLEELGLSAPQSQGNFVYVETPRADSIRALVAGAGIAIRSFGTALRITCPGEAGSFARLKTALRSALRPEAILFDMDGVLADVSGSYRAAILGTAKSFGAAITDLDVDAAKAEGGANDDWALTWRLITAKGVQADLGEVTARFEELYQGTLSLPGLRMAESLLLPKETLTALSARYPLGIVTGRPRSDAYEFMARFGITGLFRTVITRDDADLKPSPAPTRSAMDSLDVRTAWLLGDTPDDIVSARGAGAIPIGVLPPSEDDAKNRAVRASLTAAGAGAVLQSTADLIDLLDSTRS